MRTQEQNRVHFGTHHKQQPVISSKWPVKPHPEKEEYKKRQEHRGTSFSIVIRMTYRT